MLRVAGSGHRCWTEPRRKNSTVWRRRISPVAGDHPLAEHLVRGLRGFVVDREFGLARVLRNQLEAEMKVFKPGRTKVANGLLLVEGFAHDQLRRLRCELDLHAVVLMKTAGKFV